MSRPSLSTNYETSTATPGTGMGAALKVAFLTSRLDCNDGVASHIEDLASQLVRQGVELTMITGLIAGAAVSPGRYSNLRRLFKEWCVVENRQLRPLPGTVRKTSAILRSKKFDLVHVHGVRTLLLGRLASVGTDVPIVTTYHPSAHGGQASDFKLEVSKRDKLLYRIFLEVLRPSSLIALSSDTYRLFAVQAGWSPHRVRKIICGVDTSHFRPPTTEERRASRSAVGVDDDTLILVLPGRLNLNKGHDVVIASFDQLRKENPDLKIKCLFPGAGAQAAEIEAMIRASSDPELFVLLGFVPDIRSAYWAADAVVLPSRNEGFAIVVAEAMACGCAAIRTPSGGSSDQIIEGETGYVIDFDSAEDMTRRVRQLCTPGLLEHMRSRAEAHAHKIFSAVRMGEETLQLYLEQARTR
jgi:glycosyltransferase involved in cell wall biosynthesis